MPVRSYPEHNPFPHQGSVTIDEVLFEAETNRQKAPEAVPTLALEPISRLRDLVGRLYDFTRTAQAP